MEAGDFLIGNNKIIASITSNGRNRLHDRKGGAGEWTLQESDRGQRGCRLWYVHMSPIAFSVMIVAQYCISAKLILIAEVKTKPSFSL